MELTTVKQKFGIINIWENGKSIDLYYILYVPVAVFIVFAGTLLFFRSIAAL